MLHDDLDSKKPTKTREMKQTPGFALRFSKQIAPVTARPA